MQLTLGKRRIVIEYQVVITVFLCVGWSLYYLFSTTAIPDEGPESVLFIRPLVIVLVLCGIFVLAGAIKLAPINETSEETPSKGIFHPKRLVFVISLFVYAGLLPFLGFLIPSILYLAIMCFYLGLRRFWTYMGLWIGYGMLLWIAFKKLMGVPIPIWPNL